MFKRLIPISMKITIPTLHNGQAIIATHTARFKVITCGRRWGKSEYLLTEAENAIINGLKVGYFVPQYKLLSEFYERILEDLNCIKQSSSKIDGVFRATTGGRIDFWSLENPVCGRSRKYHIALLDEVAFAKDSTMTAIWERAIKPTLLDYGGRCMAASTPNGINEENFFYLINHEKRFGFTRFHAPTHTNPYLPKEELEKLERENPPLVFKQEYLAEFVDWGSAAFFSLDWLLANGQGVPYPERCDTVFAIVDSAIKSGIEHDGTAVIYCARSVYYGIPLVILDYDLIQIDGALLETWLPTVFERLEQLGKQCGARMNHGVHIEDKASGQILLQQANRRGWNVHAIDSKLTAQGKDERAIAISSKVYQGMVKLSLSVYDKVTEYKGLTRNQLLSQILTFKPSDNNRNRADDLLDCFTYAVAIGLLE